MGYCARSSGRLRRGWARSHCACGHQPAGRYPSFKYRKNPRLVHFNNCCKTMVCWAFVISCASMHESRHQNHHMKIAQYAWSIKSAQGNAARQYHSMATTSHKQGIQAPNRSIHETPSTNTERKAMGHGSVGNLEKDQPPITQPVRTKHSTWGRPLRWSKTTLS